MSTFYILNDAYISHHGVKGMKWGVRRYQNKDGSLTPAGKIHNKQVKYGLVTELYLATLAVALVAKAAIATKEEVDFVVSKKKAKKIDDIISENNVIDKKTGLKLKQREYTKDEDMEMVNPLFKTKQVGARVNCAICSTCYDLRRRGFDVTANLRNQGYGLTTEEILKIYPKAKAEHILGPEEIDPILAQKLLKPKEINEAINKVIKSQGNGARGQVLVRFPTNSGFGIGGHSMAYDIEDGNFVIRDCQSNKKYTDPSKVLKKMSSVQIVRTDNVEPNYKIAKECVKGNEWVDLKQLQNK